jgi:peptidyl-prolyl cis-trans isomerase D
MLQLFHAFKKSYAVILIVIAVVFVMTGFGVNMGGGSSQRAAIVVNGQEISYQEFAQARKNMESRYRQMLGENYDKFAGSMRLNQQIVDSLVAAKLLEAFAREVGFVPSRQGVKELLLSSGLFAKGYDENIYRAFLQQMGMTSQQFEGELEVETVTTQLSNLITQASVASDSEVRAQLERQETSFDVSLIKLTADNFSKQVKEPAQDQLQKFYEDNSTDYETKPTVAYDYIVINAEMGRAGVQILPEDIELYYSENLSHYKIPDEVKVSRIQLNYGKSDSIEQMAALKTKAEEIQAKAYAGEVFETLVAINSDDHVSKANGGDVGWLTKGTTSLPPSVLAEAFSLEKGQVSKVISTDTGYEVIKITDKKTGQFKTLDSVKSEIEQLIRAEQGPAYAAAKAQDLFDVWSKSGSSLADLAKKEGLKLETSAGLKDAFQNPAGLFGLNAEILKLVDLKQNVIELGENSILVAVTDYAPADVPALEKIKEKVIADWKRGESQRLLVEKANLVLTDLKDGKFKTLAEAAKSHALGIEVTKGVSRGKPGAAPLSNPDIQEEIFVTRQPNLTPARIFGSGNERYMFQVTGISKPEVSKYADRINSQKAEDSIRLGRMIVSTIVNDLKAKAEITIGDGIDLTA